MSRAFITICLITAFLAAHSQDTIVTEKRIYIGKIDVIANSYFTIKTDSGRCVDLWFSKIVSLKTSNEKANNAFEKKVSNMELVGDDILEGNIKDDSWEYKMLSAKYAKFEYQRKVCTGLMIGGATFTLLGTMIVILGGYTPSDPMFAAGIVMSGAGILALTGGLLGWIDGRNKMYDAKNGLEILKLNKSTISGDLGTKGGKITLSF